MIKWYDISCASLYVYFSCFVTLFFRLGSLRFLDFIVIFRGRAILYRIFLISLNFSSDFSFLNTYSCPFSSRGVDMSINVLKILSSCMCDKSTTNVSNGILVSPPLKKKAALDTVSLKFIFT